ncbi:hypothetical protein AGOR_G00066570 [Albula goreensis]|uniref:Uncharacterized protein n=1 Tax=Albula goreensis TaxID=1534307 RepID=A0A8T3DVP7_9TELE|nr:hypothetical protein AGOR_G00066570 [Albula goreensis]
MTRNYCFVVSSAHSLCLRVHTVSFRFLERATLISWQHQTAERNWHPQSKEWRQGCMKILVVRDVCDCIGIEG